MAENERRSVYDRITNRDVIRRNQSTIEKQAEQLTKLEGDVKKANDSVASYTSGSIRIPISDMGKGAKFGETIIDENRLFASLREPMGVRVVKYVATDIWDNWFEVKDTDEEKGDDDLDKNVQKALSDLNAKQILTRATMFERRYGTSIIVLAYDDDLEKLKDPLPLDEGMKLPDGSKIRQMEPYPKPKFTIQKKDTVSQANVDAGDEQQFRLGLPRFYLVKISDGARSVVHWTRVIHDAPRLDEHRYEGVSVLDPIYDDMTVFRNVRWGMGQFIYRTGHGFPVISLPDAQYANIAQYEASGKFADLSARTYLVKSEEMGFEFVGAAGVAVNPMPYTATSLEQMSLGSRIPKAMLTGVQAGALTGSEVNEREYGRYISSEQSMVEPVLIELIDRLILTGQIAFKGEYVIEWVSPFEMSETDKANLEATKAVTNAARLKYMTMNEVRSRADEDLEDVEGGDEPPSPQSFNPFDPEFGSETLLIKRLKGEKPELPPDTHNHKES